MHDGGAAVFIKDPHPNSGHIVGVTLLQDGGGGRHLKMQSVAGAERDALYHGIPVLASNRQRVAAPPQLPTYLPYSATPSAKLIL